LITELIEGTELEKKLVAAYIIGMPPVNSPKLKPLFAKIQLKRAVMLPGILLLMTIHQDSIFEQ
jgi:hypothetical protein